MRRGLASLILGLSLIVASVAWSGFVMLHTILDPGRSERLADEMLDNTVLRGALVDAMADSIEAGIPGGATLPRATVEAAAGTALDDPRVEAVVRDGLVRMHQNALNGVAEPVVIDPSAFGASARDALVQARPELDGVLPAVPPAAITLPDTGLSFLGGVRDFLERTVELGALASLAGAALALLITSDRPAVLRRVALWAFAASAFWLIVGFGIPWLAGRVMPDSAAVFAAGVEVFLGAMIFPALLLAGAGLVLLVLSLLWAAVAARPRGRERDRGNDRRPAPAPSPAGATSLRGHGPPPQGGPPPPSWAPAGPPPGGDRTAVHHVGPSGAREPSAWDRTAVHRPVDAPSWDQTRVDVGGDPWSDAPWAPSKAPEPSIDPWAAPDPPGPAPGPDDRRPSEPDRSTDRPAGGTGRGPRWVEGIGYLEE